MFVVDPCKNSALLLIAFNLAFFPLFCFVRIFSSFVFVSYRKVWYVNAYVSYDISFFVQCNILCAKPGTKINFLSFFRVMFDRFRVERDAVYTTMSMCCHWFNVVLLPMASSERWTYKFHQFLRIQHPFGVGRIFFVPTLRLCVCQCQRQKVFAFINIRTNQSFSSKTLCGLFRFSLLGTLCIQHIISHYYASCVVKQKKCVLTLYATQYT